MKKKTNLHTYRYKNAFVICMLSNPQWCSSCHQQYSQRRENHDQPLFIVSTIDKIIYAQWQFMSDDSHTHTHTHTESVCATEKRLWPDYSQYRKSDYIGCSVCPRHRSCILNVFGMLQLFFCFAVVAAVFVLFWWGVCVFCVHAFLRVMLFFSFTVQIKISQKCWKIWPTSTRTLTQWCPPRTQSQPSLLLY